jgi:hypothetical protein
MSVLENSWLYFIDFHKLGIILYFIIKNKIK